MTGNRNFPVILSTKRSCELRNKAIDVFDCILPNECTLFLFSLGRPRVEDAVDSPSITFCSKGMFSVSAATSSKLFYL